MPKDDSIRLRHMLDAAREVMRSTDGRVRADLESDHIWTLGLVKCIEIIGEAAAQIGSTTREAHSQIPWTRIVAMRNRLVHAYFDIDFDQVWATARVDIPHLAKLLEKAVRGAHGASPSSDPAEPADQSR